ncbi:MAG: hypothetical protein P8100_10620 [bacterium]
MVRKDIAYLLAAAVLIKLLYFTMAVLYTHYTGDGDYTFNCSGYIQSLKKNDSYWYEQIAREGYPKTAERAELGFHDGKEFRQSAWAFFPLYPLLISLFTPPWPVMFYFSYYCGTAPDTGRSLCGPHYC